MSYEALSSFVIVFREAFEALLIVSIIAVVLHRLGRYGLVRYVYLGGLAAVLAGIGLGLAVLGLYGGSREGAF